MHICLLHLAVCLTCVCVGNLRMIMKIMIKLILTIIMTV